MGDSTCMGHPQNKLPLELLTGIRYCLEHGFTAASLADRILPIIQTIAGDVTRERREHAATERRRKNREDGFTAYPK